MSFATTFELEGPDRDLIAQQILKQKKRAVRNKVDLAQAITGVYITDTIRGSSTLEVSLRDPDYELLVSGFFDPDKDGKLDAIELNYPEKTKYWWRLTQVGASADETIVLTWMERSAVYLMNLKGPVKAKSRAKTTRAEFIKWLTGQVKKGGGIDFHSRELHKEQPIGKRERPKTDEDRDKQKAPGINKNENLTIKDAPATPVQLHNVELHLDIAEQEGADRRVMIALCMVGINETLFRNLPYSGDGLSRGTLQLLNSIAASKGISNMDQEAVALVYLNEGAALAMGAVEYAKKNPSATPAEINQAIWGGTGFPLGTWTRWADEATALVEAYGGGGSLGGGSRYKQYNFDVGSKDNPHESYWAAINRLAEEVNWAVFLDGNDIYYDAETTLIKQKPAAVIKREEATVVTWNYDWDSRRIATEMTLDLLCEPFEFRAGQVFKLEGFGPASRGSTADLPGRWLIAEISRQENELASSFTLVQPKRPNPEPAPELAESSSKSGGTFKGGPIEGSPKDIIDNIVLPMARENGINRSVAQNDASNYSHGPTSSGGTSDHQGPPNIRWAADMSNGGAPTPQMDQLFKDLAEYFDIPVRSSGYTWGAFSTTHSGFRFQIIYRSDVGGNHYNHVHFGLEVVG